MTPPLKKSAFEARAFRDAALRHLARYACSQAGLRRVLQRRAQRLIRAGEEATEDVGAVIEGVITALAAQGLLNDTAFAESRVRSLADRGLAVSAIKQRLSLLGVDRATVAEALERLAIEQGREGDAPSDHAAAVSYARRRRLGPWRAGDETDLRPDERAKQRDKDLMALARRGFSLSVARAVLESDGDSDGWEDGTDD